MGGRFPIKVARLLLLVLASASTWSGQANAVTASWPAALTGVTADVVARMRLPLRDRILDLASYYGERTDVPYVWGGDAIGDPETCEACRTCVEGKKRTGIKGRLKACPPCRKCGIDCSHFASHFFREAGLDLPFASTATLRRMSRAELSDRLGLIDVGRNLADARPGDLLLHNRHVTILLKLNSPTHGDILHSSRSNKKGKMGGIEIARDKNLLRFRGRLIKILRREELMLEDGELNHLASQLRSE